MNFASETEQLLQLFIILSAVLLIPVTVAFIVVLFKLAFLIHSTSEFLTFAANELSPVLKDIRLLATHFEEIGQRASSAVKDIGNVVSQTTPLVKQGANKLVNNILSVLSGINRSFERSSG